MKIDQYKAWVALLLVLAGLGGFVSFSLNRSYQELQIETGRLRAELDNERNGRSEVIESIITKPTVNEISNQPSVADRVHVKELCEGKYKEVDKELLEFALSPGFANIKSYYETKCAEGAIFDRLSSPYYCSNKKLYVITRETFVPYCEDYYLSR